MIDLIPDHCLSIYFAVGADGDCLDIFSLVYHFSLLSPSFCID